MAGGILLAQEKKTKRPNILFAIADDQSFPHAGAYGQMVYKTPVFDSVAKHGILFMNAFAAAPQCSPSRAAILTGRQIWQLEEAGTHSSLFPKKFPVFTEALEQAGYHVGFTGKPWAPGNFKNSGWTKNPVGAEYNKQKLTAKPTTGISNVDYVANFQDFIEQKTGDQPFFFWFGANEPHREYEPGSGGKSGLSLPDIQVPAFLPNTTLVKNDLLDYALEIEWFDKQLGKMLQVLEKAGELDNTIVIITADNGMPFPYAKANMQEFGTHVPLAISGPGITTKGRKVNDLVGLIDIAPTCLEIAGLKAFNGISGKSLLPVFTSAKSGLVDASRQYVLTGRERHSHARTDNMGYPSRAIRTHQYLYIKNYKSERWPLGDPPPTQVVSIVGNPGMKPITEGYEDIDASPTKTAMIKSKIENPLRFRLSFEKRGSEELYDILADPFCMKNLADVVKMKPVLAKLSTQLTELLIAQSDPRALSRGDVFDSYPRYGLMRPFDGFKEREQYNPAFQNK